MSRRPREPAKAPRPVPVTCRVSGNEVTQPMRAVPRFDPRHVVLRHEMPGRLLWKNPFPPNVPTLLAELSEARREQERLRSLVAVYKLAAETAEERIEAAVVAVVAECEATREALVADARQQERDRIAGALAVGAEAERQLATIRAGFEALGWTPDLAGPHPHHLSIAHTG